MKVPLLFVENTVPLPNNTIQVNLSKNVLSSLYRFFADTIDRKTEYIQQTVGIFPMITSIPRNDFLTEWVEYVRNNEIKLNSELSLHRVEGRNVASYGCLGRIIQIYKYSKANLVEAGGDPNPGEEGEENADHFAYTVLIDCVKRCELDFSLGLQGNTYGLSICLVKEVSFDSSFAFKSDQDAETAKANFASLTLKLIQATLALMKYESSHKSISLSAILQQQQQVQLKQKSDSTATGSSSSTLIPPATVEASAILRKASLIADVVANSLPDKLSHHTSEGSHETNAIENYFFEKLVLLQINNISDQINYVLKLIKDRLAKYEKGIQASNPEQNKNHVIIIQRNSNIKNDSNYSRPNLLSRIFNRTTPDSKRGNPSNPNDDDDEQDLNEIYQKLSSKQLPSHIEKIVMKELKRIKKLSITSPEYTVIRNYLETLIDIPWSILVHDHLQELHLSKIQEILNQQHYGLDEVKKRILQYVAVLILTSQKEKKMEVEEAVRERTNDNNAIPNLPGTIIGKQRKYSGKNTSTPTILCLLGPPGVGKTSLAKSIAKALQRPFEKISLGGVHDEAEIRGHRKTYVGAFPGTIVQALRRSGCLNPVILLDEIDKIGNSANSRHSGDPQAALLEALDPDSNDNFIDHYLNVPIDLSHVLFIATANYVDSISSPLLDRMEIIQLSGYTNEEKLEIAMKYLVPKQLQSSGITQNFLQFERDGIDEIISSFTREAGVRQLEREIGNICRNVAMEVVSGASTINSNSPCIVNKLNVKKILGHSKYSSEMALKDPKTGIATGMAWTSSGGDLLFIEVASTEPAIEKNQGNAQMTITGNIGKVMEESCNLGLSWIRSNFEFLQVLNDKIGGIRSTAELKSRVYHSNLHIHVPGGAIPKDGPSAGCAIVTALVSSFLGIPIDPRISMTGEVTLRGAILPVGGIKEKLLAASRGGIRMVLLPAENHKDVEKLPRLESLTIIHLSSIEELLEVVFMKVNESKDKYLRDPSSISKSSANASADQNQLQEAKGAVMTGTIIPPRLLSAL